MVMFAVWQKVILLASLVGQIYRIQQSEVFWDYLVERFLLTCRW